MAFEDGREIRVDIQDEAVPFQLTAEHCCGIPAFVALWVGLFFVLIAMTQHVVEALFEPPENAPPFLVMNVTRSNV
jgi:hypothetical protein